MGEGASKEQRLAGLAANPVAAVTHDGGRSLLGAASKEVGKAPKIGGSTATKRSSGPTATGLAAARKRSGISAQAGFSPATLLGTVDPAAVEAVRQERISALQANLGGFSEAERRSIFEQIALRGATEEQIAELESKSDTKRAIGGAKARGKRSLFSFFRSKV